MASAARGRNAVVNKLVAESVAKGVRSWAAAQIGLEEILQTSYCLTKV